VFALTLPRLGAALERSAGHSVAAPLRADHYGG
jgi:hypothetical protein